VGVSGEVGHFGGHLDEAAEVTTGTDEDGGEEDCSVDGVTGGGLDVADEGGLGATFLGGEAWEEEGSRSVGGVMGGGEGSGGGGVEECGEGEGDGEEGGDDSGHCCCCCCCSCCGGGGGSGCWGCRREVYGVKDVG